MEAKEGNERDFTYLVHSGYNVNDTHNDFLLSSAHTAVENPAMLALVLKSSPAVAKVAEVKGVTMNAPHIPRRGAKGPVPLTENREWNAHTPLHYACA
jgi:hypothetical protein